MLARSSPPPPPAPPPQQQQPQQQEEQQQPRGIGMLSHYCLELVLQYARNYPKADIRHVKPLTPLRVEWWDPREEGAGGGKRGVWHFNAYDAGTLAAELYVISLGKVDQFRCLDGGLLYLIGEYK